MLTRGCTAIPSMSAWICAARRIRRPAGWSTSLAPVRGQLDHNYLNEIDGLETPTLETISQWIWARLKPALPQLHRVTVRRGTCGEGCVFEGG